MFDETWARYLACAIAALNAPLVLSCENIVGIESLTAEESGQDAEPDSTADAGLVGCPEVPPEAGACVGSRECIYDCSVLQDDYAYAACLGGSWHTTRLACGAVDCGESSCQTPASVCLEIGKHEQSCVANPCRAGTMTVDCACADVLCVDATSKCEDKKTDGFSVTCSAN